MPETKDTSLQEIHKTLDLCNFCTRMIGLSFIDDSPASVFAKIKTNSIFLISALSLTLLVVAEIAYVTSLIIRTASVAEFVTSLHIVGYGSMSFCKLLTLWFKRHTFRKLIEELADIWPVTPENQEEADIKQESLKELRLGQFWYAFFNVLGVIWYNITPILIHLYRKSRGLPSVMGYVWHAAYPFDKTKPINHVFVYAFECFAGSSSMWTMVSSDMIFTSMASHIGLLLRVLQVKIRRLGVDAAEVDGSLATDTPAPSDGVGYYQDINTFSLVNLINVMLSSVNICCVMFVIVLLEPWMEMSNKFFLGAALTQVGILCWYADEIYRASVGVADAVYASGWYNGDVRARRALVVLIQSSDDCSSRCSNVFDPVCGRVDDGASRNVRRYQNLCHLNKIKCILGHSFDVKQVPGSFCGIKEHQPYYTTQNGRRINDFGIVGAAQECNHTCPTFCVDTYDPVCAQIWNEFMNKSTSKPMINHCHVDLFSCSYARNVTIQPLTMCYSTLAKQLQFESHVAAMKSLGLIGGDDVLQHNIKEAR
ncbi:hypothetical protein MSG28_000313 [Choristoneura fumiferana]|uniref:Uncharacterized protein n=1 Tax=Choristoneura fumiferana TaxID=7141 RepID=A0ACC0K037_CHOFU|nr:hypothetical protein MSG28_000313 [Choristoneura fumiferana]